MEGMKSCAIVLAVVVVANGWWLTGSALAIDLMYGCCNRPACGKVCKLVCEPTKLTAIGYGCECKEICIPGPSRQGCKHCETRCCCDDDIKGGRPKMEFCWYDWFACGCAQPRTIRVLTKYQAEKKVPFYHWEVVDGCNCCCPGKCNCVYKPAPAEAAVGDVLALSEEEQVQVTSYLAASEANGVVPIEVADDGAAEVPVASPVAASPVASNAPSAGEAAPQSGWKRLAKVWPFRQDSQLDAARRPPQVDSLESEKSLK